MIYRRRARIEKYIDEVPAAWTIMYDLCRLSESQFSRLVDDKKLRPDLTTDTIKFYSALFARAPKSTDRSSKVLAIIRVPSNIEPQKLAEVRLSIGNALKPLLKGIAAKIDYPESKSDAKASARRDLAINLHDRLKKRLSKYKSARAGLSATNYELVENAAWQHQHKFQKGAFPRNQTTKRASKTDTILIR